MPPVSINPRRVVITGIGVITPIGNSKKAFWENLNSGRGGIDNITYFDTSDYPVHFAGEVKDFDLELYIDRREARHMDPFCHFAVAAGIQAVEDAKIDFNQYDPYRCGVIIGSGIGGMYVFEEQVRTIDSRGPRRISPFFIVKMISDIAAGHISIKYNLRGPNYATTSACATSAHAIGCAVKTIRYGEADVMISGGAEAPITNAGLGGFCAMKALSTRNDAPEKASRPFDRERDGFIMAEGAGIVVLEELDHALKRGAYIYGEIAGIGFTADAHHVTAPPEDGHGAVRAMENAIYDADLMPSDIEYINAHGTSTPLNDISETNAIKKVFGDRAYKLTISSTKSMTGHLLGAAGAVELIATILALQNNRIPPTINYEFTDPGCDLNYTPNQAIPLDFNNALSNAFGFGGHNVSIAVKRLL